jgi:hypothetical protein
MARSKLKAYHSTTGGFELRLHVRVGKIVVLVLISISITHTQIYIYIYIYIYIVKLKLNLVVVVLTAWQPLTKACIVRLSGTCGILQRTYRPLPNNLPLPVKKH